MYRKELVWGVNGVWCAIVFVMAMAKFFEIAMVVQTFREWGLRPYLTSIGLMELASLALYIYPPTLRVGFFLLCSVFGGAIATTLQRDGNVLAPFSMLIGLWLAAYLRGPQLFENVELRSNEFDYLRTKP
jgi:hypothetical protein